MSVTSDDIRDIVGQKFNKIAQWEKNELEKYNIIIDDHLKQIKSVPENAVVKLNGEDFKLGWWFKHWKDMTILSCKFFQKSRFLKIFIQKAKMGQETILKY